MLQGIVWTLNIDLLFLNVDLDLRQLGVRQPDLNQYAIAMRARSIFIRQSEKHILGPQMLLHQNVELRLWPIIRHLLSLDIDLLLSPYARLLVPLLLLFLLFLVLLQGLLCGPALNIAIICLDLDLGVGLGHLFFLFTVNRVDRRPIDVTIVVVLVETDHVLQGVNRVVVEHF